MKQFKSIFIFGVIVLLLVGVMIIQYATPSRMVDFRGEILSVSVSDTGVVILKATTKEGGDYIFRMDDQSKLENCCGEEISINDLLKLEESIKGKTVDINYRKYLFKKEDVRKVKTLKVYD